MAKRNPTKWIRVSWFLLFVKTDNTFGSFS